MGIADAWVTCSTEFCAYRRRWRWLLVFLLPALEASAFVGVIIPGEIGVILGGVLANQHKLPLAAVLRGGDRRARSSATRSATGSASATARGC